MPSSAALPQVSDMNRPLPLKTALVQPVARAPISVRTITSLSPVAGQDRIAVTVSAGRRGCSLASLSPTSTVQALSRRISVSATAVQDAPGL